MGMAEKGLGYPDLDDLVKNPQPLIFTMGRLLLLHTYASKLILRYLI